MDMHTLTAWCMCIFISTCTTVCVSIYAYINKYACIKSKSKLCMFFFSSGSTKQLSVYGWGFDKVKMLRLKARNGRLPLAWYNV